MGGRVAEELIFRQLTTGAVERHPGQATDLARKMVCEWGMSDEARARCTSASGRARCSWAATSATPARSTARRPRSRSTARSARIVTTNYDRAKKVVVENVDKLKALAEALLEHETIDGAEIDMIFAGQKLERKMRRLTDVGVAGAKAAEKPPRPEHLRAAATRARQGVRLPRVVPACRPDCRGLPDRRRSRTSRRIRSRTEASTPPSKRRSLPARAWPTRGRTGSTSGGESTRPGAAAVPEARRAGAGVAGHRRSAAAAVAVGARSRSTLTRRARRARPSRRAPR